MQYTSPFSPRVPHDSYVPYKYAMEKFVHVGSIQRDHIDPSIFCVLTAKSKTPGAPLADFLIFSGRWDVATGTFRPPVSPRYEVFLSRDADRIGTDVTGSTITGTARAK